MKSRISSTLLLFCLIIPIITIFTCIHYQKRKVRKQIKHLIIAGIDREELELLKFTKREAESQLKWKHSKEFKYQGQMYDVVESEIHGDTTYYWCWWDNDETRLHKQLDELLANAWNTDSQQKENSKRLIDFYKLLYFEKASSWQSIRSKGESINFNDRFDLLIVPHEPPIPPPDLFSFFLI